MMREAGGESALDAAARRLERAVAQLEAKVLALAERGQSDGLFDQDRAKLAAELDASHAREKELAVAGAEASAALGRAIAEIRAALGDGGDWAGGGPPDEDLIDEEAEEA